jgi:hypothetical protein
MRSAMASSGAARRAWPASIAALTFGMRRSSEAIEAADRGE